MTILIVDDEYYSVENLRRKLDWADLGFEKVLCAYSAAQAQEIFIKERIDVLLSDIEMPQQNGLDLLEWVRGQGFDTVCVFLTCYAEFTYASRALQLGCRDYVLKPVEQGDLLKAIERAVDEVHRLEAERSNAQQAGFWKSGVPRLTEQFWAELANGRIPATRGDIEAELQRRNFSPDFASRIFVPIYIDCITTPEGDEWKGNLYEYAVKNILLEVLLTDSPDPDTPENTVGVIAMDRRRYLILYPDGENRRETVSRCERTLSALSAVLPGIFRFFVGVKCLPEKLPEQFSELKRRAAENVAGRSGVLDISREPENRAGWDGIPAEHWDELLLERKYETLRGEVMDHLHRAAKRGEITRRDLISFYHDFSQVIYARLERSGGTAHELLIKPGLEELGAAAVDGIGQMEKWAGELISAYVDYADEARMTGTVIAEIREYIRQHLSEEISRKDLAAAVFLSPDYLSHIFSEKVGMSLTAYITRERICKAKELLSQERLSIRDVAIASGFQNISYFSKQFKRIAGVTPQEFRKRDG